MKQQGILLHITSLDGEYGIGDLGEAAFRFADYLAENDFTYWQVLPLNHCGYGNSPYNPISAFAFNPYLISLQALFEDGLLTKEDLASAQMPSTGNVDFESVKKLKGEVLRKAAINYLKATDIDSYIEDNAWHLKPYLAFCVLGEIYGNYAWYDWNKEHREYSLDLYERLWHEAKTSLSVYAVWQLFFEKQMTQLKEYLKTKEVSFIGDMPIYLSYESAEVWAHQHLFDLDQDGKRLSVAGVPPDAFSETGQLWGNPIYRWDKLHQTNYELFTRRIAHILQYLDFLRLDHFIGYVNYWKINCPDAMMPESASNGCWVRALPEDFFFRIKEQFGTKPFIAEDLGILNNDVCSIRDSFGFPGMIILQFCFEESVPNVQDFPFDRFIYTGTHDNQTTVGWWDNLPENSPSRLNMTIFCKRYLSCDILPNRSNIHQIMHQTALVSGCERLIIPMQDILGLDDDARMNIPGTALGNWQWRMH